MSAEAIISLITGASSGFAILGILFFLFVTGKLHGDAEMERERERTARAETRADRESEAREKLEEALGESRRALAEANARAEAAVRASELIANALTAPSRKDPDRA